MRKYRKYILIFCIVFLVGTLFEFRVSCGVISWTKQSCLSRWFGGNAMCYGQAMIHGRFFERIVGKPPYYFDVKELNAIAFIYFDKTFKLHVSYRNGEYEDEDHDPMSWIGFNGVEEYSDKIYVLDSEHILLQKDNEFPPEGFKIRLKKIPKKY